MIIRVGKDNPAVSVLDVDGFGAFSVELLDPAGADDALRSSGVGYLVDAGNACIEADSVISLANRSSDPDWRTKFDGMLDYARKKGWLTEDGRYIRAHVEPVG